MRKNAKSVYNFGTYPYIVVGVKAKLLEHFE